MSFPIYKKISINSHQKRLIHSQLDQLDFGNHPYIFEMSHMIKNQEEALTNIEAYFFEHSINLFTYPVLIVANINNYTGRLTVVNDIKKIPRFFKMKKRQLSTKETQKLNYVELKQKHMQNLQLSEFEPILNEYTRNHKTISMLNNENEYFKSLIEKLFV